jgi:3-phenylpropionate/trans-cinnamate dioxygenase ferredoxin reductase subunit
MSETAPVVIVGAGHGGVQAAASLREEGYDGKIVLLSAEPHLPYQRPPLSKAFLKREVAADALPLRGEAFYAQRHIDLLLEEEARSIDRGRRLLHLASGATLSYRHLVLATGGRQRRPPLEGAGLDGVLTLRSLADAERLRERLDRAASVAVIGAGFIGLEFAAVAAGRGLKVHILELGERPMGRAVSPVVSDFYTRAYRALGADIRFGASVVSLEGDAGKVTRLRLASGERLPVDLVLVGIGMLPCVELAAAAGLACPDGIEVDEAMSTADAAISAIGDCALHPNVFAGRRLRLESVQNAVDQARVVAKRVCGRLARYTAVPWFWSDQGDLRLQIAGLVHGADKLVLRGAPNEGGFSVFAFADGRLLGVESINRPGDHMAARRLLGGNIPIRPEEASDPQFDLKARVMSSSAR